MFVLQDSLYQDHMWFEVVLAVLKMFVMMSLRRPSTSSRVHERRRLFWLISRAETATPPALAAWQVRRRYHFLVDFDGIKVARHVGTFRYTDNALSNQTFSCFTVDFAF